MYSPASPLRFENPKLTSVVLFSEVNSLTVFSRAESHKQHTLLKEKETMAIAAGYGNSKFVDDAQVCSTFFNT